MENSKIVNLSFDDKGIKVSRNGDRTIVSMVSYFANEKLGKFMNDLGFVNLTDVVNDTLKSYGYKYDYKLGGWATKTRGIVILDPRDSDDQGAAVRMAATKAKVKAYARASRCMRKIKMAFADALIIFDDSQISLEHYLADEKEALGRVLETGYCNPDKQ